MNSVPRQTVKNEIIAILMNTAKERYQELGDTHQGARKALQNRNVMGML
jgi:hypothetical protein